MYSIVIDGKPYCAVNVYKTIRHYFKTINVPEKIQSFTQPILTANGTIGADNFAVSCSGFAPYESVSGDIWKAFDGNTNTYWRCNEGKGWVQIFNSKPLKISKMSWTFFYCYPTGGSVQGSNDGIGWDNICTWTNVVNGNFDINVNSAKFYKYYKLNIDAVNTDVIHCKELKIVADEIAQEAYDYEVEVAEGEPYDRFTDETYLEGLGVKI